MELGLKGKSEMTANDFSSAKNLGSGSLDVFSTPMLVAMLENAALNSVQPYLEEGQSTVGTKICISHDAATPLGMKVTFCSELIEIDGRRLVFQVEAFDEKGRIGGGTHERFIVNAEKFQNKTDGKLK